MEVTTFGPEELSAFCGYVWAMSLRKLVDEGTITEEQRQQLLQRYAPVAVTKKSLWCWLGRKLFGKGERSGNTVRVYFIEIPEQDMEDGDGG